MSRVYTEDMRNRWVEVQMSWAYPDDATFEDTCGPFVLNNLAKASRCPD